MKPFSLNNTEIQKTYGSHWVCSENACTEEKIVYDIEDNYSIICSETLLASLFYSIAIYITLYYNHYFSDVKIPVLDVKKNIVIFNLFLTKIQIYQINYISYVIT